MKTGFCEVSNVATFGPLIGLRGLLGAAFPKGARKKLFPGP